MLSFPQKQAYVHRLRQDAKETPDYIFDKIEYATVIAEIKNKAQKAILEKEKANK